jgi:ATP-binding cassette subfamily B protein
MKYQLSQFGETAKKTSVLAALKKLLPLLAAEKMNLIWGLCAILVNAGINLLGPILTGRAVDKYILAGQYRGVLIISAVLLGLYLISLVASYLQTKIMGTVGQNVLFNLRNAVFNKLQELPVAFYNENKAGDLISRINNDTDKLNQFFSQSLMQFIGNVFIMAGAGIFLLSINFKLGAAALAPALLLLIFTQVISAWVKARNRASLQSVGGLSAEIQESLNNFKVIVAFNRRNYFREKFDAANSQNYRAAVRAGVANNMFTPIYALCANLAQLIMLSYGLYLIAQGQFTIGLFVSFIGYISRFYDPLRQLAALWANFQVALAGWDRISEILALNTDLATLPGTAAESAVLLEFKDVHFGYPNGKEVLRGINLALKPGQTYALVGPTGGGKTTTASLMARLYDPTQGTVLLNGADLRAYTPAQRTAKIGFILQEPFLFTGTIRDNILYGNESYRQFTNDQLAAELAALGLEKLLTRFPEGLDTNVLAAGDTISLGQKQLIAFIRAVLRRPDLLILDEATANVDTVTEQLLGEILTKLPATTTRVIIAHRLNTIENADEIFFVNSGELIRAGSMDHAVDMLLHGQRAS